MQPGLLRERIQLQRSTESRSSLGEISRDWQTYVSRWASVQTLKSQEAIRANQQAMTITHKVRLRHADGLKATDRVLWRGRILEIVSVLEYEQFTVHELLCEEQAA